MEVGIGGGGEWWDASLEGIDEDKFGIGLAAGVLIRLGVVLGGDNGVVE